MKKFECKDGAIIEVRSDFAVGFRPDSCQCNIIFELNTLELDFPIQVCQLHKNSLNLITDILNHNNSFNLKFGNISLTEIQSLEIARDKNIEYQRILGMGNPEIRADSARKNQIESDLRSKGR